MRDTDQHKPPKLPTRSAGASDNQIGVVPAVYGVIIGLALNALTAGMMLTLLKIPAGSEIRPMGHAVWCALFAAIGLFVGVPISSLGLSSRRRCRASLCILGALLNLAVWPVGAIAMRIVCWAMGLTLEP